MANFTTKDLSLSNLSTANHIFGGNVYSQKKITTPSLISNYIQLNNIDLDVAAKIKNNIGLIHTTEDTPNDLIFTNNEGNSTNITSFVSNAKLQTILSLGNKTSGFDIDFTDGSKITSSTGNIIMEPSGAGTIDMCGGDVNLKSGSTIISSDGNIEINAINSSGSGDISLIPKGGSKVTVIGNLDVMGTTTTIDSENVLVQDNCIYLNNGYTATSALPGCIVINYFPTAIFANVAVGGFTAGPGSGSGPTVDTDNSTAWSPGDIIQISGANNISNDGLFEVDSYSNPTLTIRGIGGASTTFNFFQKDFTTDATVAGTITKANVSAMSSGADGNWEMSTPASNTSDMLFVKVSPCIIGEIAYMSATGVAVVATGSPVLMSIPTILRKRKPSIYFDQPSSGTIRYLGNPNGGTRLFKVFFQVVCIGNQGGGMNVSFFIRLNGSIFQYNGVDYETRNRLNGNSHRTMNWTVLMDLANMDEISVAFESAIGDDLLVRQFNIIPKACD